MVFTGVGREGGIHFNSGEGTEEFDIHVSRSIGGSF